MDIPTLAASKGWEPIPGMPGLYRRRKDYQPLPLDDRTKAFLEEFKETLNAIEREALLRKRNEPSYKRNQEG